MRRGKRRKRKKHMSSYGIWCGKDAAFAAVEEFSIAFLRVRKDLIVSVLKHRLYGTVSVVYGQASEAGASAGYCAKNPATGISFCNGKEWAEKLELHSGDTFYTEEAGRLIYTMYDGSVYEMELAESVDMRIFERTYPADPSLPLAKRMALWGINKYFYYDNDAFEVGFDTEKYSVCYKIIGKEKFLYCRLGQNGYCERGWAMLSTVCIRFNECRMLEDHRQALREYKPVEECFVTNGCAFPPDGGWYWSVKSVTDDAVSLNGCNGATYVIRRRS